MLIQEIQNSSIVPTVGGISPKDNGTIDILFDGTLSGPEEAILDTVVANHTKPIEPRDTRNVITFEGGQISSGSFSRVAAFIYEGGEPYSIEVLGYCDENSTGEVRLYDKTNCPLT